MNKVADCVPNKSGGFSLVESLLVIMIIGAMVFLIASIPNAMSLISKSMHLSIAREIAVKQIEDKRSMDYANLVNDTSAIVDSRLSSLPEGSGLIEVTDCAPDICTSGESAKEVKVMISWQDNLKTQNITLKTLIGEGGVNQ